MSSPRGHGLATGFTPADRLCTAKRMAKTKQDHFTGNQTEDSQLTRRGFCSSMLLTSAGLLIAAEGLKAEAAVGGESQAVAYPPTRIEGAEALMPGSSLYFGYPRRTDPAILVRSQEGDYYAFGQRCSHMGCSVYLDRAQRCLRCPCHGGAYDSRTGFVLQGPPKRPIDPIYLQMRAGGEVWAVGRGIGGEEHVEIAAN